ncbi:MAG TPA: hypothetical protein VH275_04565 [Solirubrobacterales bacterium]|jgi:hypothetical protein|nr:hypothetical protein [Solirubrobacterales bacterium]
MKRIATAVAVSIVALGLAACGGGSSPTSSKQQHLSELAEGAPDEMQAAGVSAALLDLAAGNNAGAREALATACPGTSPDDALENLREAKGDIALSEEAGHLSRMRQREYVEIEMGKVC